MTSASATSGRLRIGIGACFFHADPKRPIFKGRTLLYLEEKLVHWVMSQGALAYLIPTQGETGAGSKLNSPSLEELSEELDGLVLQGGSDVAPESYGEKPMKPEWSGDRVRDLYEIELIRIFRKMGKPVLGACRGAQILNVALGGTLYQDISTQVPNSFVHRDWEIYDTNCHEIEIHEGTALSRLYPGVKRARVNTVHHQGIKDLAGDLSVEAISPTDQIVEAVRAKSGPYCVGVQWHPEWHPFSSSSEIEKSGLLNSAPILEEFLRECRQSSHR